MSHSEQDVLERWCPAIQPFSCSCRFAGTDCRGDPANRSDKLMVTPCRVRKVVHLLARSSPLPQTRNEPELLLGDQIHHMHRVRRVWASITSSLEGFPDPLTKWPSCLRKLGHCKDYAGVCDGYSSPTFARQSRLACVATSFYSSPCVSCAQRSLPHLIGGKVAHFHPLVVRFVVFVCGIAHRCAREAS